MSIAPHARPPTYKKVLNNIKPNQTDPTNKDLIEKEVAAFK
ncbi:MAG: hypothetical protein PHQ17_08200 [Methanobacterium sp.]|nr:hypothetical protein [Methanobacterium sp.]